jgi:phenylacetate-CoA ligase
MTGRDIYGTLYRNALFPAYDRLVKRRTIHVYFHEITDNPRMPLPSLREIQRRKLRALLDHCARHVPYYRRRFEETGLDVGSIGDIGELRSRGIFTSKEIIRSAGADLRSDAFAPGELHRKFSSGSTGTPIQLRVTRDYWCLQMATKYRAESWIGKTIGTPTTYLWGHRLDLDPLKRLKVSLYWRLQNYQFVSAFEVGEEALLAGIARIKRFGPRFIEAYVSPLYLMARLIEARGIEPPRLDGIVTGGESLFDYQREQIERSFRCPVYNRYGCSEFMNVAHECLEHRGMHINADGFIVEVLDGAGRPVVGEEGEIVITDLNNYATPLVRYRIGDRAVLGDRACACGRTFPLMEKVVGRTSDAMKAPDGHELHSMYFHWRVRLIPGIYRFQVAQKAVDRIEIRVVHDGSTDRDETGRRILEAFADLQEHGVTATLAFVDDIPLSRSGKMNFFVSEMPGAGASGTTGPGVPGAGQGGA